MGWSFGQPSAILLVEGHYDEFARDAYPLSVGRQSTRARWPRRNEIRGVFLSKASRSNGNQISNRIPALPGAAAVRRIGPSARRIASRHLAPLVRPYFSPLVDDFYAEIENHPDAKKVITGGEEQIARLKKTLISWLEELFSGRYDREYVERRWRVGFRHVEIGLNQVYTNAALSRLRRGLLSAIATQWQGTMEEMLASREALNTLIDLDLALIEDAYQTEFQRRQAVAERLATIGKVAGGVAHELRNPLNVVKTSVYFILNAKNASPEKIKTHLERIERQVGVADRVITALNDFARLPVPELDRVEVEPCLRDVLEVTTLPGNVAVEWSIDSPSPAVLGDRAQLYIVFSNLVRNARDCDATGRQTQAHGPPDRGQRRSHDSGHGRWHSQGQFIANSGAVIFNQGQRNWPGAFDRA